MTRRAWLGLSLLGGVLLLVVAFYAGHYVSFQKYFSEFQRSVFGDRFSEFILIKENLERHDLNPQMREYFKDRLYVIAAGLPPEVIRPEFRDFDFGPVDRSLLQGVRASMMSGVEGKSYELAKSKHNPQPSRVLKRKVQSNPPVETDARKGSARGSP
jgi:hypothetical protein